MPLALDDERTTFHPVLWTEAGETPAPTINGARFIKEERISQVWFPGVHSNVGGGYPDNSLANVSLAWMMQEAQLCGLRFKLAPAADPDALLQTISSRDKDGRLYDSRQGLGGYYRYGPRKLELLCDARFSSRQDDAVRIATPKIHQSAFERGLNGAHVYAPIGLPAQYAVVMENGQILEGKDNPYETPIHAAARAKGQEHIWNLVWWRRVVYFATLAASAHLLLFPLIHQTDRAHEFSTPFRIISETVRLIGAFVPGFFNWWINAYAANPGAFAIGALLVAFLILIGGRLGLSITDNMRTMWKMSPQHIPSLPKGIIYPMRTSPPYQACAFPDQTLDHPDLFRGGNRLLRAGPGQPPPIQHRGRNRSLLQKPVSARHAGVGPGANCRSSFPCKRRLLGNRRCPDRGPALRGDHHSNVANLARRFALRRRI